MNGADSVRDLLDIDLIHIDREMANRGFRNFISMAWHINEPIREFVDGWHIDAIADHLQACYDGEITRLVINVPPKSMKSLSTCVLFPAWLWTQNPSLRTIFGSYNERLSKRDSNKTRRIVDSDWYRARWIGSDWYNKKWKRQVDVSGTTERFDTTAGGFRIMTTVEGGVTGDHADFQFADDPVKPLEVTRSLAVAETALNKCKTWWNETMSSRLMDAEKSCRIVIMQRLVDGDLAGLCVEKGYEHLMLPMEFEPKRKCFTSIGFEDPRQEQGELLWPENVSQGAVDTLKEELGSRGTAAQLQQDPMESGGNLIKEHHFRFYIVAPAHMTTIIQSWDCAFKDTDSSDFVVGQVWGLKGADKYLLDQARDRMSFSETCNAIRMMTTKWPKATVKLVEDKANGPAVIDTLKREISGMKPINPEGGKLVRVHAVEPQWESGNVWVPHPDIAPWVKEFRKEVIRFPSAPNDDQVDAMSQALTYLEGKSIGRLKAAMENVKRRAS